MTQYDDVVEKQRQKIETEEWAKKVKQIYAHDGLIETWYNNGDIHYQETKDNGRSWITKSDQTEEELQGNYSRYQVDKVYKKKLWNN